MKRLLFVLTIALVALSLNSAPVAAQATGNTDVDITLEGIVILHYFGNVDVTITSGALGTFLTGGPTAINEGDATPAAGGMIFDLAISPSGLSGNPSAAVLTLENAWAVRSLGGATDTTRLAITVPDATLNHIDGPTMTISAGAVNDGDGGTTAATIQFPSTGLATPEIGDVQLTLNMTDATAAGEYADGVFTLTATLI